MPTFGYPCRHTDRPSLVYLSSNQNKYVRKDALLQKRNVLSLWRMLMKNKMMVKSVVQVMNALQTCVTTVDGVINFCCKTKCPSVAIMRVSYNGIGIMGNNVFAFIMFVVVVDRCWYLLFLFLLVFVLFFVIIFIIVAVAVIR